MNNSLIIKDSKTSVLLLDFCVLPFLGVLLVIFLTTINNSVIHIYYQNSVILINYWFFIHVINTLIVAVYYPYNLTMQKFWTLIIGWEIIENILIPNTFNNCEYFKEDTKDIIGDLIAPLPASLVVYFYRNQLNHRKIN